MITQDYYENRRRFPISELEKHRGAWVAFSADGRRIIASAPDLVTLDELVVKSGEDPENVGWERIEPEDSVLGGTELL